MVITLISKIPLHGTSSLIPNKITDYKQSLDFYTRFSLSRRVYFHRLELSCRACSPFPLTNDSLAISSRANINVFAGVSAISPDLEEVGIPGPPFKDFTVSADTSEAREIKMRVSVSGEKTQKIFDDVFSKLVAAAQPIPGFRRLKGGKTPDIPKDILLHIIGPSKVNNHAIKKIINSTVAEYVEKEKFKVTKDLRVEQSFEELEADFEPGKDFIFDAIIQLQGTDMKRS